jgi:hypothetical protein
VFASVHRDLFKRFSRPTHSARLERWLGRDVVEQISQRMRSGGGGGAPWYGPPIALAGVPGRVYACGDGDFCGPLDGGYYWNLTDYVVSRYRRTVRNWTARHGRIVGMGFISLSDLISEATTGGKKQVLVFQKTGVAQPAVGASASMWRLGVLPAAGAAASTLNAGTVYDNTQTGRLGQVDAGAGDTLHFVNGFMVSTVAQSSSLLLCDLLFAVNRNYNDLNAQAITGVPTRYQTAALAPGNLQFTNVTTALGATASNLVLTYVDDAGNAAEAGSAQAVRVSSAVDTSPTTAPAWFYTLNAGDRGLRNLSNFDLSAAMGAGNADRMIVHPLALLPGINVANQPMFMDGLNSAFNLERIYDGATLMFIEWFKSATAAATYSGQVCLVSG